MHYILWCETSQWFQPIGHLKLIVFSNLCSQPHLLPILCFSQLSLTSLEVCSHLTNRLLSNKSTKTTTARRSARHLVQLLNDRHTDSSASPKSSRTFSLHQDETQKFTTRKKKIRKINKWNPPFSHNKRTACKQSPSKDWWSRKVKKWHLPPPERLQKEQVRSIYLSQTLPG